MALSEENGPDSQWPPRVDPELPYKVMDGLNAGVYITDAQERIIAVNPRAEELLARSADDFLGENAHDLLHRGAGGRYLPRSQCQLMKAFFSGKPTQGGKKWFARGDNTLIPVVWLLAPYDFGEGTTGAVVLFHERDPRQTEVAEPDDFVTALSDLSGDSSLLSESTAVLASTLEVKEALRRLVRLVTPRLTDWAIVDLVNDNGELHRVGVVHYHEGEHVNVAELEGPMPPVPETSTMPLSRVLRGAPTTRIGPQIYTVPPDADMAVVQRALFHKTGIHSAIAASLRSSREVVLGALTLGRAEQSQDFGTAELALLEDIARRAGLAVDNARLYERQQRIAETMQRYLLPPLPDVDGLDMVARYKPAPHASEVGGDWYDVFLLPDGTSSLVVGDVVGHDIQAAGRMAEIRSMLRGFAWDHEEPPSLIVERLDRALPHISRVPMATLVFARVEGQKGGPWQLRWTNAGHPPPLLVTQDGQTQILEGGGDLLLGTGLETERTNTVTPLPPLTTVLLYTDGMIESPSSSVTEGITRLVQNAAALVRRPLDEFCDQIISRVQPDDGEDDIALIALRVPNAPEG